MYTRIWAWIFALLFIHPVHSEDIEQNTADPSLLWGPYRPNLYFGIRPRIPQSLLMGLMWAKTEDSALAEKDLRHTCEQSERMAGYGWNTYDPHTGGSQTIHDASNFIDITTEFLKPSDESARYQWGARISGTRRPDAPKDQEWLVVFYIGSEERNPSEDSFLVCSKSNETETVDCYGNQSQIQNFTLRVQDLAVHGGRQQEGHPVLVRSDAVPPDGIWQAKCESPHPEECHRRRDV
jgi:mannosyl-oligosaccharide glucosidase